MTLEEDALELHSKNPGKISVEASVDIETKEDLNLVYTPGVAEPCRKIAENKEEAYNYTSKKNLVAVVSDGSAVLGLGDIGPEASMPVMEGKANLLKKFGEVDGFPLVVDTESSKEIIETVERVAPTLGAVNLEDISAPECFEIENRLQEKLDIPVFHDDQHGTAIVVLAALRNSLKLVDKEMEDLKIVVSGVGAAGIAVSKILDSAGTENILPVDSLGIISQDRGNKHKQRLASELGVTEEGDLEDAMKNADVLIGLSIGGIVSKEMVESMNENAVVFALANPDPEIMPDEAKEAGAEIVATGRSDFPNQVNNSIAFPGIFRGAIDAEATEINEEMKRAASKAISESLEPEKERILPDTLDKELAMKIASKVKKAAEETNVTR